MCVWPRACLCACVWTCQFRVELLSKTHTSNKSNVTTGRKRDGDTPPPAPPLSATVAVVADDDELSLAQYVLCVCVCIVQAASLLRSTAANFQGRVLLPPLPLCYYLLLLLAHTHYTHTTTTAVYVPMCVCKAINLMIYWRLPQNLLLFFCCCRCRCFCCCCLRFSTLLFCVFCCFCFWRSFTRRNFL